MPRSLFADDETLQAEAKVDFYDNSQSLLDMARKYAAKQVTACGTCDLMNDWGYLFHLTREPSRQTFGTLKHSTKTSDFMRLRDLTKAHIENADVIVAIKRFERYEEKRSLAARDEDPNGIALLGNTAFSAEQATSTCLGKGGPSDLCTQSMCQKLFDYAVDVVVEKLKAVQPGTSEKLAELRKGLTCLPDGKADLYKYTPAISTY